MAIVGQSLTTPETGWKRLNDNDANLLYEPIGEWLQSAAGWYWKDDWHSTYSKTASVKFNFVGSKIRLLTYCSGGAYASPDVRIIIDGTEHTATCKIGNNEVITLYFELLGLTFKEHAVKIYSPGCDGTDSNRFIFDAIDIDETGTIKPYSPNPTPVVSAPTNLTAIAGDAQVSLSWTAETSATGYNVKRSTTAGGPYTTIATNVTGTSYIDTSVTNGTTYYYVVTAVNADGESANSNEASATPSKSTQLPTGDALLRVTMLDSSEREYRLSAIEVDGFIAWYTRTIGTGISCYALNDIVDNSKEYLSFEKIISFKVIPLAK